MNRDFKDVILDQFKLLWNDLPQYKGLNNEIRNIK